MISIQVCKVRRLFRLIQNSLNKNILIFVTLSPIFVLEPIVMIRGARTNLLAIAFILGAFSLHAQSLTLESFYAAPSGADVLLTWELGSGSGISSFRLYRKIGNETDYKQIATLASNGGTNYQFLDYTIYKETPMNITYKLMVTKSGKNLYVLYLDPP